MRRALVGLFSVAVVAVVVQGEIVSSSAAPRTSDIVCPLEPAGSIPCCTAPIVRAAAVLPICCPVPTGAAIIPCPVPEVTVSTQPNPSRAGQRVTITGTGRLFPTDTTVSLWQELPNQQSFHQVASTGTDGSGAYKFVRGPIDTNRRWYVVAGGAQSSTLDQQVSAIVTLSTPARTAKVGKPMLLTGRVTPTHAGERLTLQQLTGHGWRSVRSAKIGHNSTYAFRAVFTRAGHLKLRTVLPADGRNVRSASAVLDLTIA